MLLLFALFTVLFNFCIFFLYCVFTFLFYLHFPPVQWCDVYCPTSGRSIANPMWICSSLWLLYFHLIRYWIWLLIFNFMYFYLFFFLFVYFLCTHLILSYSFYLVYFNICYIGISRINSPKGMASLSKQLSDDITVKQDWKVLKLEKTEISSTSSPLVRLNLNYIYVFLCLYLILSFLFLLFIFLLILL
jgi:hypothetical protein